MEKIKECTEDEFYKSLYAEFAEADKEAMEKEQKTKDDFKKLLKGKINVLKLYDWLNEGHDYWNPEGIVEIKLTDEKSSGYPSYQHARVINDEDDGMLYMKQSADFDEPIKGIEYYYVWQTTGMTGDDYSGYLLFELKDGKFFKISYSC